MNQRNAAGDEDAVKLFHRDGSVGLRAHSFILWRKGMRDREMEMMEEQLPAGERHGS